MTDEHKTHGFRHHALKRQLPNPIIISRIQFSNENISIKNHDGIYDCLWAMSLWNSKFGAKGQLISIANLKVFI